MATGFLNFDEVFNKIKSTKNERFNKIIQDFTFLHAKTYDEIIDNEIIYKNINKSTVVLIDQYQEQDNNSQTYLIFGFKKTIIIIDKSFLIQVLTLFLSKKIQKIYNLSRIDGGLSILIEADNLFRKEIESFKGQISFRNKISNQNYYIVETILSCIFGYLIKESYEKLNVNRRLKFINLKSLLQSTFSEGLINEREYIDLRSIGKGSSSYVRLVYNIEKEELFAIKKQNSDETQEASRLIQREIQNLSKIDHPFIPKFYGTNEDEDCIVVEYIKGKTLDNLQSLNLNENEKITIIFELMVIIEYLHRKRFIIRDIKPDNLIIDDNKDIVLIDFDRMIENDDVSDSSTKDLLSFYIAPEVTSSDFSYPSDIYSLGYMIYFIIEEKKPTNENLSKYVNSIPKNPVKSMIQKCIEYKSENRPSILNLILYFYKQFHNKIQIKDLFNVYIKKLSDYYKLEDEQIDTEKVDHSNSQYLLGCIYLDGVITPRNINKAIHYLTLSANLENSKAQVILGSIYTADTLVKKDIKKGIEYLVKAADKNNPDAQFFLGYFYSHGEILPLNEEKAVYYLTLAANQNEPNALNNLGNIYLDNSTDSKDIKKGISYITQAAEYNNIKAQLNLGMIYLENKYVPRNIEKSIHYLTLAAKQNNRNAQYYLGSLYYSGIFTPKDINKSINYFLQAANQNKPEAQYYLGWIYYEGKYVRRNVKKSIYYLTKSAENNLTDAQYALGCLYHNEKYIKPDINKALYYYKLAADNNSYKAQYNLGFIYLLGKYVRYDIDKAIHYLTLSAKNNFGLAKYVLAQINLEGVFVKENQTKGVDYMIQSVNDDGNSFHLSSFITGYLYHFGISIEQDIQKAIKHYKDASSFNIQFAKNNLGIIYTNGFEGEIDRNINWAIEYFNEAIKQKNDHVAMYNLAHLYLYDNPSDDCMDDCIKLLIKSSNKLFYPSKVLLCLVSIMNFGFDTESIVSELNKYEKISFELSKSIRDIIKNKRLDDIDIFEENFNLYHDIVYVYNNKFFAIPIKDAIDLSNIYKRKALELKEKEINAFFYEGFK